MEYRLTAPMTREQARQLRCGDTVLFTGTIYTARDAAHKRLVELLDKGEPLPFDVNGAVIYYAGPTPAQKGHAVGSCGPTTSYRMDAYAPKVIAAGSTGMIGKGKRDEGVVNAMKEHGACTLPPLAAPAPFWPGASRRRKWWPMRTEGQRPAAGWKWWTCQSPW